MIDLIVFAARLDEIVKAPCPSMIEGVVDSGSGSCSGCLGSSVFVCRRWKNKKLLFSLDLGAIESDVLGDEVFQNRQIPACVVSVSTNKCM